MEKAVMKIIKQYIDMQEYQVPIFTSDIYNYVDKIYKNEYQKINRQVVNQYIKRIVDAEQILERHKKGVYYKAKTTPFGNKPLNDMILVQKTYIVEKKKVIGFETGPSYAQKIGLTTQLPKMTYIMTNKIKNKRIEADKNLILIGAKVDIKTDNYQYYQLLDLIDNKYKINFDVNKPEKIFINYIKENKLNPHRLLKIAYDYIPKTKMNDVINLLVKV